MKSTLSFLLFLLVALCVQAQTNIQAGTVSGVWTVANSPYTIEGDIRVDDDKTLTIMPGVVVRFDKEAELRVNNEESLIALGKPDSVIIFTSNEPSPSLGDWVGIIIRGTYSKCKFKHCLVEYARNGFYLVGRAYGCDDYDNRTEIDSCIIRNNSLNGIYCDGYGGSSGCIPFPKTGSSSPTISNCRIYNNGECGVKCEATEGYYAWGYVGAIIVRNVIFENQNGIYCLGDDWVEPDINNNTILNNTDCGIKTTHNFFNTNNYKIINNIIAGNVRGIQNLADSTILTKYNNVWNNTLDYEGTILKENNISADPLFFDAVNNDYHLTENSPCIDAGDPDLPKDPDNTISDIGAFFFRQAEPVVAQFAGTPVSGTKPLQVSFTDSSTGTVSSYLWNFGDGTSSSLQNPTHIYQNAGSYNVSLQVTGTGGTDTETKANYITVNEAAPVADFTANPTSGNKPLQVNFTNNSSGTITSYLWNFGDGTTSTLENPSHTYQNPGNYDVSLQVTGPGGSDTKLQIDLVTIINETPNVNVTATPRYGENPLTVNFSISSEENISDLKWEFGDGNSTFGSNPEHVYNKSGVYDITLHFKSEKKSGSVKLEKYITVYDKPTNDTIDINLVPGDSILLVNQHLLPTLSVAPLVQTFFNQNVIAEVDSVKYNPERTGSWVYSKIILDKEATIGTVYFKKFAIHYLGAGYVTVAEYNYNCRIHAVGDYPVGITPLAFKDEPLKLYPNPANDYFILEFEPNSLIQHEVCVYNESGQKVYSNQVSSGFNTKFRINTTNWSKGMYFIRIREGGKSWNKKVILK